MADLKEILKKLNKDKKEEDKISLLKDKAEDYLVKKTVSTGSPYLDYRLGGGFALGGYNCIIADGGTGKTSIALKAIKDSNERLGKVGVFWDAEGTMEQSYLDRMGVTEDYFLPEKSRNLEYMLDTVEALATADDVGVIVLDSIPVFVSSVVEAKSAGDNNMAVEARKFTARMPIVEGNCAKRNIAIIGLTSYKLDPSAMGDPRKLSRGMWQYTMSNVILDLTKKDIILDKDKNPIGHKLDVRIKKSKLAPYNPKEVITLNFYYEGGFNEVDEYAQLFGELGIVKVGGGGWTTFPDRFGEEKKVQGLDVFTEYLKANPEDFEFLKQQLV
jgi:RecA/RadA recombinase